MNNVSEGPLATLFRGSAIAKMLDCLVQHRDEELSKQFLAKETGISWKTVWKELPYLEQLGLIKFTGKKGVSRLFMLNIEDAAAQNLVRLSLSLDSLLHMLLNITLREKISN